MFNSIKEDKVNQVTLIVVTIIRKLIIFYVLKIVKNYKTLDIYNLTNTEIIIMKKIKCIQYTNISFFLYIYIKLKLYIIIWYLHIDFSKI